MNKKPNILYITSHDTGRYIQPFGHAIVTPHLQKLAEEGVLFRQNFCAGPTCSPSRAALLTGCYPHENGMLGLAHRGFSLNDYGKHIIHTLRPAGYSSVLIGHQHIARQEGEKEPWQVIGYAKHFNTRSDEAANTHEAAAAFLRGRPEQPFFLSVGFTETHRPFPKMNEASDDPRYCLPPAPLPDGPETRQDMTRFKASARKLDYKTGVVLAALEDAGLADNTLVICTTDHGMAFPRMKCTLYDGGIGVMLIMRGPGGFRGGRVIDSMTSHLDIFPTICDLLGIAPPPWLRGKSLLPLIRNETDEVHEQLFFEINFHAAYEPMRAVRTKRWKYIKRYDHRRIPVLPNCDIGESRAFWLEQGWGQIETPEELLFDLIFDPMETNNLADDKQHADCLMDMKQRLENQMRATDDPLLKGNLRHPPTAILNDPDGSFNTDKPVIFPGSTHGPQLSRA